MRTRRHTVPRRRLAAAAGFLLLLSGGTAGAAESPSPGASPDAAAAGVTVEPTVSCRLPAGQGDTAGPQRITVELSPATVAPGGTVHVEVDLGPTPATSPLELEDAPFTAGIEFALSGGAGGTVTVFGKPTPVDVPLAPARIQVPSYEGEFMMPLDARRPVRLTPTRTLTVTRVLDRDFETPCAVRSGAEAVGTVDVSGEPGPAATLTVADGAVEPGAVVELSGTRWTPGAEPRAVLCGEDGAGCSPAKFARTALEVSEGGRLSGSVTLAEADAVPSGDHRLRVFDGAREAGARLAVEGGGAAPDDLDPSTSPDGPSRPADSFPSGPSDGSTAGPSASPSLLPGVGGTSESGSGSGLGSDMGQQHLATYITPGPLAMTQSGDAVDFGTFELGQQSTATAALNTVTVSDGRGRNIGWSLTATLTDLTSGSGRIPASAVSWVPSCVAETGSVGRPTAGAPGPLGPQASSLCTMRHHARTPLTGGKFRADASLSLTFPGYVPPGEYKATLQLTLL
ncbi:hypothetical protein H9Y04_34250 [Streptomyces sp. TRM66268-LWL]|uniref:WxL domain-containing protein n=1 Tax=Streptomyces polyasparticus TaxID=2767826 RepID=A0ABR7SQ29_9ACTN|nr:hypothetical protein [Streptomyces polyasparticus]MBC9717606.1 hypothetical protein [Streptomyces polyasparticus]